MKGNSRFLKLKSRLYVICCNSKNSNCYFYKALRA
ncbi:MAG TPA: TRASH domain-containing protein [Flavobacteriia bacterium]|nr:TRASH domain-containing protein [Flavobacteriia bacterium]